MNGIGVQDMKFSKNDVKKEVWLCIKTNIGYEIP